MTSEQMKAIERAKRIRDAAWFAETVKSEISRLESILRNPRATAEEKRIASDMLAEHKVTA
jgi:hypothetical protein